MEWISGLVDMALSWLGDLVDRGVEAILTGLSGLADWLAQTLGGYLSEFTSWLGALLQPVWDLFLGLGYFLAQAIDVVILALQVFLLLVQLIMAVGTGLLRTVGALATFDPAAVVAVPQGRYALGISLVLGLWEDAGGTIFAAIVGWAIWLAAAWAVLRIVARRG